MKILILGSKGQIGEHLYNYLKEKNYKVVGLDIVNSKSEDLRNKNNKKFNNLITKVDFIFFLQLELT
jgi:nucleoside-diphosphate-sugar epimerase